jgi:type VII secretion system ESX-1 protein EccA1
MSFCAPVDSHTSARCRATVRALSRNSSDGRGWEPPTSGDTRDAQRLFDAGILSLGISIGGLEVERDIHYAGVSFKRATEQDPDMCDAWLGRASAGETTAEVIHHLRRTSNSLGREQRRLGLPPRTPAARFKSRLHVDYTLSSLTEVWLAYAASQIHMYPIRNVLLKNCFRGIAAAVIFHRLLLLRCLTFCRRPQRGTLFALLVPSQHRQAATRGELTRLRVPTKSCLEISVICECAGTSGGAIGRTSWTDRGHRPHSQRHRRRDGGEFNCAVAQSSLVVQRGLGEPDGLAGPCEGRWATGFSPANTHITYSTASG